MKNKKWYRIIILMLGISIVLNGYLFIENQNKTTNIVQLNKKNKELNKYSQLFKNGTDIKFVDIKESDSQISMAYLYQDKELIERHGIGVIIDNTYYKISIGPDIGTTLNNNSKILKITDDEVVFTFNLDNDMKKKRLTVKSENKDIHFKLEDIN